MFKVLLVFVAMQLRNCELEALKGVSYLVLPQPKRFIWFEMEPLGYLLEPALLTLILTTVAVHDINSDDLPLLWTEMERNLDISEATITLDRSQALIIPVMSSCCLLLMFYIYIYTCSHLFHNSSQLNFTAVASASSLYFCLSPFLEIVLLTS